MQTVLEKSALSLSAIGHRQVRFGAVQSAGTLHCSLDGAALILAGVS